VAYFIVSLQVEQLAPAGSFQGSFFVSLQLLAACATGDPDAVAAGVNVDGNPTAIKAPTAAHTIRISRIRCTCIEG
jgi:hypothetical protein